MILEYTTIERTHTHPDNEIWIEGIDRVNIISGIGQRRKSMVRYTIRGVVQAASAGALTTALAALELAYSVDYGDLKFWESSGGSKTTVTQHTLLNDDTIGGVKVKRFRYLKGNPGVWGSGTEYVFKRTYEIILTGDVFDNDVGDEDNDQILQWHESIRQIGNGGPRWAMVGAITGPVQRQELQQFTPFLSIQQGYGVGHLAKPIPPDPIWPQNLHQDQTQHGEKTPKFAVLWNTEFGITWKYVFESATSLIGGPNLF